MKNLAMIFLCLWVGGCVTMPAAPPGGCEHSLLWQSGFMPKGKDMVELAFAALLTAEPTLRNRVKNGALKAWRLVQDGSLKGAVGELLVFFHQNPRFAPLALFALERLDLDQSLNRCDQEVLLSLCRAIAVFAGAGDQDFAPGLAELAGPRQ